MPEKRKIVSMIVHPDDPAYEAFLAYVLTRRTCDDCGEVFHMPDGGVQTGGPDWCVCLRCAYEEE